MFGPPADITSSGDIEQCLKEAAYMKDFHHPNVIQLIGNIHTRSDTLTNGQRSGALIESISSNRSESSPAPGPAAANPNGGSSLHETRRLAHLPAAVQTWGAAVCKSHTVYLVLQVPRTKHSHLLPGVIDTGGECCGGCQSKSAMI